MQKSILYRISSNPAEGAIGALPPSRWSLSARLAPPLPGPAFSDRIRLYPSFPGPLFQARSLDQADITIPLAYRLLFIDASGPPDAIAVPGLCR